MPVLLRAKNLQEKPPRDIYRGCTTAFQRCIEFLRWRGPLGAVSEDFEFNVPGVTHQTGTSYWNTLWKSKRIVPTGEKRPTRLGNPADVHVLDIFAPKVKRGFF